MPSPSGLTSRTRFLVFELLSITLGYCLYYCIRLVNSSVVSSTSLQKQPLTAKPLGQVLFLENDISYRFECFEELSLESKLEISAIAGIEVSTACNSTFIDES